MILYGLKNCDTCRKALKALPNVEMVDVSSTPVPESTLDQALSQFGDKTLNTRSTTWRGLDEAERAKDPKTLLVAHPKLMKRPLIVDGDALYLGWDKTTQAALAV
ncbi:arsenate reductase family protein [Marivita sp.]|uniref:arsenate reductase family protein n=1 Tax=Marivita sp. TaxID=2003365 RepID=UPI003F6B3AAD